MSVGTCSVVFNPFCYQLEVTSQCSVCYDTDPTICDGYSVLQCQISNHYTSTIFDAELPWIALTGQVSEKVGTNLTFTSNRDFEVSNVAYLPGEYISNFTFTSSAATTELTWTWISDPQYLYFVYPNMSIPQQPFSYPTPYPTWQPVSYDDDDDTVSAQCSSSACPTSCANGYTKSYTKDGCTVYCKDQPTNGQCEAGGTGCTSSCRPISVAAIIGIIIGGVVLLVLICVCVCVYRRRQPMAQRESEMTPA